jgi:hypothetical protein
VTTEETESSEATSESDEDTINTKPSGNFEEENFEENASKNNTEAEQEVTEFFENTYSTRETNNSN